MSNQILRSGDGPMIGDWELAKHVSEWIEIVAIAVIAVSVLIAMVVGARDAFEKDVAAGIRSIKRQTGRGLLLGLDLLIAGGGIRTVTLQPTLENVSALGVLVVVRTFLAWSIVVELRGRWPWQLGEEYADEPVTES
ncbi:MAG: DUF1622 domain-containing protein [Ilumatobacter sp.]|nr:DUF1622 domain-containing protein [Ilumatobacter sp.]